MADVDGPGGRFGVRWHHAHSIAMLFVVAVTAAWRAPGILALWLALSFFVYVVGSRGEWTPQGKFGLANVVTMTRAGLTLTLLWDPLRQAGVVLAFVALSILLLDVVDGWLARRSEAAGEFGGRFDVEVDAAFVTALAVLLWVRGVTGPWVLVAGLWRYVYVLVVMVFPSSTPEIQRARFARFVYVATVVSFVCAFVLPGGLAAQSAALGTLAVSVSFLRSFWQRYRPLWAAQLLR